MSKITNDSWSWSGTGCFIAVFPYGNSGCQRVKGLVTSLHERLDNTANAGSSIDVKWSSLCGMMMNLAHQVRGDAFISRGWFHQPSTASGACRAWNCSPQGGGLCLCSVLTCRHVSLTHLLIRAVIEDWYHVSPALLLWLVTGAVINRVMSSCIAYLQTLFFGCFFFRPKTCKNGHETGVCEYTVQLLVALLITVLTQLSLCSATELAIAFRSFSLEILWRLLQWCILCIFYILFILFFIFLVNF